MSWSDEVSSCKDASTHLLLKVKLDRKLRQPSVLASTGKSMSVFFFFFLLEGILDEIVRFLLPVDVIRSTSTAELYRDS